MTYDDFLAELALAGLTVRAFAELIGMNKNSVSNYARVSRVPTHLAVIAKLLSELKGRGIGFEEVLAKIDRTPKKPRGGAKPGRFGGDKQEQLELPS
ncbi:XRE family transcriptional regulator [Acidovorax sp. SUPP2539]|uniref:XRE family transcriptional regulator n=1 Tax=Acidovorax sp. SUPP2539 TaxID=2920878 RepID=UPI0023DE3200|nr:XRE family transcriptional regulator [Acidovorax sp. SUPP2539]GKS88717.1 DNA-binding protein [Acidovorax sp. SUPP2539]